MSRKKPDRTDGEQQAPAFFFRDEACYRAPGELLLYTRRLSALLGHLYPSEGHIKINWCALTNEEVVPFQPRLTPQRRMYSPLIDIAVGPFAQDNRLCDVYDALFDTSEDVIDALVAQHQANIDAFGSQYPIVEHKRLKNVNQNARCFVAIEIERANRDPKYLMGSAVNASALGRLGIFVAWNVQRFQAIFRIREYLQYLKELEKNSFDTSNLLILDKDQLMKILTAVCERRGLSRLSRRLR